MKIHFLCEFNIWPHLDILEYGKQNSICWNFKNQISKCPALSEILPPILAHIMPYRPSTKQILYLNHFESSCTLMYLEFPSINLKCIECLWFPWITSYFLKLPWLILYDPEIPRNTLNYIECLELPLFTINCLKCHALH